jgi:hypothetical protein
VTGEYLKVVRGMNNDFAGGGAGLRSLVESQVESGYPVSESAE